MALETNFNVAPYFDDFDANNNFYRVLFKPSVAVQARELTQMQTILQDQIDKFGRHVFKDGSVVEGCTLNFDDNYAYIKIRDQYANGEVVNVSDYVGYKLVSSSNLQAQIVNYASGLESSDPDLNTFYVRYLNSAVYANNVPQKTFDPSDTLSIKTSDDILIANVTIAGPAYSPIGVGYAASVSEGTVFKKGFFIRVEPQTIVVSKYNNTPGDVIVGFVTNENIVTADADTSLYDNAVGSPNYTAPGANRLRLTANLVYRTADNTDITAVTSNTANFFTIATFNGGKPVVTYTDPQYNILQDQIARRTYEESGDYIVDPFELSTSANTSNTQNVVLEVDKGIGYVRGYRVEFINKNRVDLRKGNDERSFPNQITTANYGNYVVVNELCGAFDTKNLATVNLYSTPSAHVTAGDYEGATEPTGLIGTAKIRDIQYISGTPGTPSAQYRIYLFDIVISAGGFSFADVKSIYTASPKAYADPVLLNGAAQLQDTAIDNLVFPLGASAVKTINTTATSFVYRSSSNTSFSSANGSAIVTLGTDQFNVSGSLSESNEARFVVVAVSNGQSANLTGSINANTSTANIIGTGTTFTTDFVAGDYIKYFYTPTQSEVRRVVSVTNSTFMLVNAAPTNANVSSSFARFIPKGSTISFERNDAAYINVTSTTSATFQLGFTPTANIDAYAYYDVYRGNAVAASKAINKSRYVKIQANTHPAGTRGPWCLGLPDVTKIRAVYQGTTYANTNPNRVSNFTLDDGQRGGYYGLSYLYAVPGYTLGANDVLLVELDHFTYSTGSGVGYFSINSYPIDDANTANTNAIVTAEVPLYTTKNGLVYDLRDCIDFRPVANATIANTALSNNSFINPSSTQALTSGAGAYTVAPDSNFVTAFTYYLGRKDKVVLSPQGKLSVIEGNPATIPNAPRDIDGSMTLGTLIIPPYPSLSQDEVRTYGRKDYSIAIDLQQNRRYTMRDIGIMDKKFARLEYYTSLNLLEASAKTLVIKDDTGAERFKNGFVVDPFRGFTIADTQSQEFKAAIDIKQQELAPRIRRTYVDVDFDAANSTNVTKTGELITLSGTDLPYIQQPFASKFRNCVENIIYVWNGNIKLTPDGDAQPDIDVNPDVVGNIDLSGLTDLINSLENIIGDERITSSSTTTDSQVTETPWMGTAPRTRTTTTEAITVFNTLRTDLDVSATTINNTFDFGELVQDVSIQKFIRPRRILFHATGIKPNTRVYAYFDGIPVSTFCTPTNSSYNVIAANRGSALTADANGNVYGAFDVPGDTFKTGERVFRLADVDSLITGADAITTQAAATYSASNISITKARYSLETRLPQIAINTIEVVNSFTTATTTTTEQLFDPIAQTFLINEPTNVPGVFVSKIDVFFRTAHPNLGVEMQVREVDNGFPTVRIVPYGRKVLTAAEVNVSSDASVPTTFQFDSPLFLKSGREYCFVVMPVGSNDGYNIWVGEVGGTDVTTNTPIYDNNSTGVMFTSSTNRIWTPFQKEDIKFVIHRKNFSSSTGTISYRNSNTEYLTVSSPYGNFIAGEKIAASNGNLTYSSNVWCNTTSNTITVNPAIANAQTTFTVNTVIFVSSNSGLFTDVRQIVAIPAPNQITLNATPTFADNAAILGTMRANGALFGYASRINTDNGILHLYNSSANSGVGFTNVVSGNALLIGLESRARANLVSVDTITYSTVIPQFSYVVAPGGTAGIGMKGMGNTGTVDSSFVFMNADMETFFTDKERIVKSYSKELQDGTGKSLYISVPIGTDNSKVSPMFDDIKSSMLLIQNRISNTASLVGETNPAGANTEAKYISKTVVLAEGQDAEDVQVYLSAYKPSNTNINVYVKFLNGDDSSTIEQKSWTPLNQNTASSVVSSRVNRNDFKEFLYDVPVKAEPSESNTSTLSYYSGLSFTNNIVSNTIQITAANSLFNVGDLVFYVGNAVSGIANGYFNVNFVNSTAVALANTGATSNIAISNAAGSTGQLYSIPTTAFRDITNGNTVSYFSNNGGYYYSYKTFAIKIVMTSDEGTHLVPRVSDMRAIALQA